MWLKFYSGLGGALQYLEMVGNFYSIDPHVKHFPIPLGPFLSPDRSDCTFFSADKNQFVSVTFSSRDNMT